jgi:hypothetical protein
VCTLATKSFEDLEIVLPRPQSGLGDNFSVGSSKYDFASLIYKYLFFSCELNPGTDGRQRVVWSPKHTFFLSRSHYPIGNFVIYINLFKPYKCNLPS